MTESFDVTITELSKKKIIAMCPSCGEAQDWSVPLFYCQKCGFIGLAREIKEIRPRCLHDILEVLEND